MSDSRVKAGDEVRFEVEISFKGEPYAVEHIQK